MCIWHGQSHFKYKLKKVLVNSQVCCYSETQKLLLRAWSGTTGIQHTQSHCFYKGLPLGYHQTSIYLHSRRKTNVFGSLIAFPNLSQNLADRILGNVVSSFLVPGKHGKSIDQRFSNFPTSGKAEFMVQVQPRQKGICKHLRLTTETPKESALEGRIISQDYKPCPKLKDKYETDLP